MTVKFAYGSKSQYDKAVNSGNVIADALYFINDSNSIYRGEELIVRTPVKFVTQLPKVLEKDTVYAVTTVKDDGTSSCDIYVSDGETALNTTDAMGEIDVNALFSKLPMITSKDNLDDADDSKLITAGAVRKALDWTLLPD